MATLELGGGEVGANVNIQQSGVFFGNDKVVDTQFMNSICSLGNTDCMDKITKTIKKFKRKINFKALSKLKTYLRSRRKKI